MTYKGIAAFACMNNKFPIRRVLSAYPRDIEKPATAILYEFFGDNWKFPTRFCKKFSDRPHLIQWHLCFRNPVTLKEFKKRTKEITSKMQEIGNDNTKIIICPVLEDACSDKRFARIVQVVKQAAKTTYPDLEIVRNPYSGGKVVGPYDYEEHHGRNPSYKKKSPQSRIYNPDGLSVDFKDGERYFNKMSVQEFEAVVSNEFFLWLIWTASSQGLGDATGWESKPPSVDKRKYIFTRKAKRGCLEILKNN